MQKIERSYGSDLFPKNYNRFKEKLIYYGYDLSIQFCGVVRHGDKYGLRLGVHNLSEEDRVVWFKNCKINGVSFASREKFGVFEAKMGNRNTFIIKEIKFDITSTISIDIELDDEDNNEIVTLCRLIVVLDGITKDVTIKTEILEIEPIDYTPSCNEFSDKAIYEDSLYIDSSSHYPKWFKTSPRSKDLPIRAVMSDEEAERYDRFADEWDKTRFAFLNISRQKTTIKKVKNGKIKHVGRVWYIHSDIPLEVFRDTFETTVPILSETHVNISVRDINEALKYKNQNRDPYEELGSNRYDQFNHIMQMIFELEGIVCEFAYDKGLYDQVQSLAIGVVNWLEVNVGYGQFIGKYRVTEFAEMILQDIEELPFLNLKWGSLSPIKKIAKYIDHLAFRVCAFFGFFYRDIKDEMGRDAVKKYDKLRNYNKGYDTVNNCRLYLEKYIEEYDDDEFGFTGNIPF